MVHTLASRALLVVIGMSLTVNAVSFENFIDPLLSMSENHGNLDLMEELISSETANTAARFFLSYINSTTTITASYALVIILGVAVALLGILGLGYMTASTIFTGTSVQSYYGKRSLPDGEEEGLDFNWIRIMQILHQMDEHFRRLGAEKSENDCRKRIICKLSEKSKSDIVNLDKNQQKLVKLTNELSGIYENNKLDTSERLDLKTAYKNVKAYHEANNHGRKHGKCNVSFPKCDSV